MLEEEREFFAQSLPEWLTRFRDKVVLVKGKSLVDVFDTEEDALAEGARRFQVSSFLVRRVQESEEEIQVPALTLGILRAKYPHSFGTEL